MYAVLQQGGHQYRVAPGDRLILDRLSAEIGSEIELAPVLLFHDGQKLVDDSAELKTAKVIATVVAHRRGPKLRVFKYKPKKRYRRTQGYRSNLTEVLVGQVGPKVLAANNATPMAEKVGKPTASSRASAPRKPASAKPAETNKSSTVAKKKKESEGK